MLKKFRETNFGHRRSTGRGDSVGRYIRATNPLIPFQLEHETIVRNRVGSRCVGHLLPTPASATFEIRSAICKADETLAGGNRRAGSWQTQCRHFRRWDTAALTRYTHIYTHSVFSSHRFSFSERAVGSDKMASRTMKFQ